MSSDKSDVERRAAEGITWVRQTAEENTRIVIGAAVLLFALNWIGIISLGLPSYWPLIAIIAISTGVGGWFLADRAEDLLPEPERVYVIDMQNRAVRWFTPDEFAKLEVVGELREWSDSQSRAYEAAYVDTEQDIVVANWVEAPADSEFRTQEDIQDVWAMIDDVYSNLVPAARRGRKIRRQLPGIVRKLDMQRDRELASSYEAGTVDSGIDEATIESVLDDVLDDDLTPHPHAGGSEKANGSEFEFVGESDNLTVESTDYDALLTDNGNRMGK